VLDPDYFRRPTLQVAHDLIGKLLVRGEPGGYRWGRLVELEAYLGPDDRASHAAHGVTARTRVMYGPPGRAYVYLVYGLHHCLNFVTCEEGVPHAILVRALDPGPGVGRCAGPGLLCRALDVDLTMNGSPLTPPSLFLVDDGVTPDQVVQTPRIGVAYAGAWALRPWRFCLPSPHLSRPLRIGAGAGSG